MTDTAVKGLTQSVPVCLQMVVCHALCGAARGLADVRFHGNAALQRVHDQLLENLGLDLPGTGDSGGLVTHAIAPTLTHAVTPAGYGGYGVCVCVCVCVCV